MGGRHEKTRPTGSVSTSLLYGLKRNDQQAWERLVEICTPLVYSWCRKAGLPPEDARDVGQEVFTKVAANIRQFRRDRPGDTFRGWLYTITRNKILDFYRHRVPGQRGVGGTEAQQRLDRQPDPMPAEQTDQEAMRDEIALVHHAIATLEPSFSQKTWQAFWRTAIGGESPSDVAMALAMSLPAVYQAKYRVLQRFREEMAELF